MSSLDVFLNSLFVVGSSLTYFHYINFSLPFVIVEVYIPPVV